jgi:hypothetical protein
MEASDRASLTRLRTIWPFVQRELLQVPVEDPPAVIVFDARCRYVLQGTEEQATPHGGQVELPGGRRIPVEPIGEALPPQQGRAGYVVLSLPSVFRAAGKTSALGLDVLVELAFIHELSHTKLFSFVRAVLRKLVRHYSLPEQLDDDSLQRELENNPAYVKDWQAERDVLFAAANAPDDATARKLAAQGLQQLLDRRSAFFVGEQVILDDVFLTMEGVGQWAAYAWFRHPQGRNLDAATAQREVRRDRKWWSQEEGFAIYLVVDRLLPGWQRLAFTRVPTTATLLLDRVVNGRGNGQP